MILEKKNTYEFFNYISDEVGVVHATTMVRPNTANVHALLVVPEGQVVVVLVVG